MSLKLEFDKSRERDRQSYAYIMAKTIYDNADDAELGVALALNQVKSHIKRLESTEHGGMKILFSDDSCYQFIYKDGKWKSQAGWI